MWLKSGVLWLWLWSQVVQAAPELTLANLYQQKVRVAEYSVSEKYDGVRAYWDGQQLWSRQGHIIHAPVAFKKRLPDFAVEGELWFGRQRFARAQALLKLSPTDERYAKEWQEVRLMLFDAPSTEGDFSVRLARLKRLPKDAQIQVAAQLQFSSAAQLQQELERVVAAGAEGLMLRRLAAPYRAGRSDDLLKLKPWQDAEAKVLAHLQGKGKYQGQLGALLVRLENGREVRIGTGFSDKARRSPPPIGSIITYKYQGYTSSGLPRFPVFWRLRDEEL